MDESRSETRRVSLKHRTESLVREMVERGIFFDEAKREFEKTFVAVALDSTRHNQCKAAKILGIHRNTLISKIRQFGLNHKK